jgi:predicted alpha/beta-hydrolase family hydrolase
MVEVDTPHGSARAELQLPDAPVAALMLGHGAGGGIGAPDLVAAAAAAAAAGVAVALVEQPYRVAGKRSSPAAKQLDAAWTAVAERLRAEQLAGLPLIAGGRSAGARVACRTAAETGAAAVLCLAFPLHPPRRTPEGELKTRLPELDAVPVPTLVVQGESDRFGTPPAGPDREVVKVAGDHSLRKDTAAVANAVRGWLETLDLSA